MKLKVILPFDWAHGGVKVEHFPIDAEIETEDSDLITVSKAEGWAVVADGEQPASISTDPPDGAPGDPALAADHADPAEIPATPKRGRAAK